jgi:peptide/nickel transport system permease protein
MGSLLLTRAAQAAVVLCIVVLLAFAGIHLIPGDALLAAIGETGYESDARSLEAVRQAYGMDGPVTTQFWHWLSHFVQGDWGRSIGTGQRVTEMFQQRLPVTLELFAGATFWAFGIGVPVGTISALRQGSRLDRLLSAAAMVGVSVPTFWAGILMIYVFAVWLPWLPPSGYTSFGMDPSLNLQSMLMPTFILGIHSAGLLARYVRSSLLDNMRQDYVRTARSKGLSEREVITRHAIKPSLLPIVTVVGLSWGHMLAGAFFVEVIFALPGLGRMGLEAVFAKDFPVIQALLVVVSLNVLVMNFLVDAAYALLDPRVRLVA